LGIKTGINSNGLCLWRAYETIDELLKPFKRYFTECGIGFYYGKSGILEGGKEIL
jgi:hypothetical protein